MFRGTPAVEELLSFWRQVYTHVDAATTACLHDHCTWGHNESDGISWACSTRVQNDSEVTGISL